MNQFKHLSKVSRSLGSTPEQHQEEEQVHGLRMILDLVINSKDVAVDRAAGSDANHICSLGGVDLTMAKQALFTFKLECYL